jgi:hypothetical protein
MDVQPHDSAPRHWDFLAPPQQPGELGRLGQYRILKQLGQGGMGVVFQAEDQQLRRLAALKVLRPDVGAGEELRARFLREARAAAALKHDHIVTIYQVGDERGVPFLAMEFLAGKSLEEWLRPDRRATVSETLAGPRGQRPGGLPLAGRPDPAEADGAGTERPDALPPRRPARPLRVCRPGPGTTWPGPRQAAEQKALTSPVGAAAPAVGTRR